MFIIGYLGTRQTTRSGTRITNYPDTAALVATESQTQMNVNVCERFARGRYVKVVT